MFEGFRVCGEGRELVLVVLFVGSEGGGALLGL